VRAKTSNSPAKAKPFTPPQRKVTHFNKPLAIFFGSVILHYNTRESTHLMSSKMLNLLKHHRIHVPNGLAMFAAILLLASSAIGYNATQDSQTPDRQIVTSAEVETSQSDMGGDAVQQKRRSLNLGLLLFRR
jgi:hypothetical protein